MLLRASTLKQAIKCLLCGVGSLLLWLRMTTAVYTVLLAFIENGSIPIASEKAGLISDFLSVFSLMDIPKLLGTDFLGTGSTELRCKGL